MNKLLLIIFCIAFLFIFNTPHLTHFELKHNVEEFTFAHNTIERFGKIECNILEPFFVFIYLDFGNNKYETIKTSFNDIIKKTDAIFNYSALVNGGNSRHLRLETDTNCDVKLHYYNVENFITPDNLTTLLLHNVQLASSIVYSFPKNYKPILIIESERICGLATIFYDTTTVDNKNDLDTTAGFIDVDCFYPHIIAHEMAHMLGAVQTTSQFSLSNFHCYDQFDIVCGPDFLVFYTPCNNKTYDYILLDCGGNTYYNSTGVTDFVNIANSRFLIADSMNKQYQKLD